MNLIGLHRNLVIYVDEHDNLMLAGLTMRRSPSPKDRNGLGIYQQKRSNEQCMHGPIYMSRQGLAALEARRALPGLEF